MEFAGEVEVVDVVVVVEVVVTAAGGFGDSGSMKIPSLKTNTAFIPLGRGLSLPP